MSTLYRASVYDDATYAVLVEIEYRGSCRCFDRAPLNEGHDVNPPCSTVLLAQRIVSAVRNADKETN